MKRKTDMYDVLGFIGMVGTPLAAAIIFGLHAHSLIAQMTTIAYVPAVAGIGTAVGLEIVGIYAGHTAMEAWRLRRIAYTTLASVAMLAYVSIGVYELRGTIGQQVFLIAPLMYILVGLRYSLHEEAIEQVADGKVERKRIEAEAEFDRRMRARQAQADHEARMAKIEARKAERIAKAQAKTKRAQSGHKAGSLPSDFRLLEDGHKEMISSLTSGELQEMADISASTARRWKRKVTENGHAK